MVLEFNFSSAGSSKPFLEVINFLFELNNLSLLFVENASVVKDSGTSLLVSGCEFDSSFEETFNLVLQQDEPFIEVILFVPIEDDLGSTLGEFCLQGQKNVLQIAEGCHIRLSVNDYVLLSVVGRGPFEHGLGHCLHLVVCPT